MKQYYFLFILRIYIAPPQETYSEALSAQTKFIHPGYLYSTFSSPLLLRSTHDKARIPSQSFKPKHHRQLRMKDLPKIPMWQLERNSNPWPFGRKALNLPMSHHAPMW